MNGIVHPCSHPENGKVPGTEEEMMLEVFKYTERVVNMVRPRKLLMIAVGMFSLIACMGAERFTDWFPPVISTERFSANAGIS